MKSFDKFLKYTGAVSLAYAGTTALMAAEVELPQSVLAADKAASGSGGGLVILAILAAVAIGAFVLKKRNPDAFKKITSAASNVAHQATNVVSNATTTSQPQQPVSPAPAPQQDAVVATVITPAPVAAVPAALPIAAVPTDAYIDRDDLMKDIGARDIRYAISLDGALIHQGVGPVTMFYTQGNGSIGRTYNAPSPAPSPAPAPAPSPAPAPAPVVSKYPVTIYKGTPGPTTPYSTVNTPTEEAYILQAFGSEAVSVSGLPKSFPQIMTPQPEVFDPWSGADWSMKLKLAHNPEVPDAAIDRFNSYPDAMTQWKAAQGDLGGTFHPAALHLRNVAIAQYPQYAANINAMTQIVEQDNPGGRAFG